MKVIDLSHPIEPEMPYFPTSEPPEIRQHAAIASDGYAEKLITFHAHTGTHIDAPGHILSHGKTLDAFPVDKFVGKGMVIAVKPNESGEIDVSVLKPYEQDIRGSAFVLLNTGWSERWGDESYFQNFPVLSAAAAEWLTTFQLKGLGVDVVSVDPVDSIRLPIHHILLEHELVIIENLKNLHALPNVDFNFFCLPLPIREADGSPVRAVAIME